MIPRSYCCFRVAVLLTFAMGSIDGSAYSQTIRAKLDRGFARSSSVEVTVKEMLGLQVKRGNGESILGPGFPALWIAEVQYKPVRLIRLPVTDPATNKTTTELVWYMVYRVIPRDYTDLTGSAEARINLLKRLRDEAVEPQNRTDGLRAANLMLPRFLLETTDEGAEKLYVDEVNHQIQKAVFKREFRGDAASLTLLNSVEAISAVGSQVSADDPDALKHALYGVAIWRNVDPETDFFRVVMSGFSNAYRLSATVDGKIQVEDKCIVQKFGRPGDSIDQTESEFHIKGDPEWLYRVREVELDIPNVLSVLGNRPSEAAVR